MDCLIRGRKKSRALSASASATEKDKGREKEKGTRSTPSAPANVSATSLNQTPVGAEGEGEDIEKLVDGQTRTTPGVVVPTPARTRGAEGLAPARRGVRTRESQKNNGGPVRASPIAWRTRRRAEVRMRWGRRERGGGKLRPQLRHSPRRRCPPRRATRRARGATAPSRTAPSRAASLSTRTSTAYEICLHLQYNI